jgi:hypothetical protein
MFIQAIILLFKSNTFTLQIYTKISPYVKKAIHLRRIIKDNYILQALGGPITKEINNAVRAQNHEMYLEIELLRKEIQALKNYLEDHGIFDK